MKNTFTVTGLGLAIDKVMIMPGSELMLSGPAPGHWARFGEAGKVSEKEMVVATPAAGASDKTKKRVGLEAQAADLKIAFTDETSDDDLIAQIKAAKDKAPAK